MKITIIDHTPIYLDSSRGELVKKALLTGQDLISIDGDLYRASSIMAVTDEDEPNVVPQHRWGMPSLKLIESKNTEEPVGDGRGRERYEEMRKRLMI